MGNRINELKPVFVQHIPRVMEEGVIYISEEFGTSNHLCACGCGEQTVLPLSHIIEGKDHGWHMMKESDGTVTFTPSIGNFNPSPYHAHYYITKNKIVWC